jgi:putative transposase
MPVGTLRLQAYKFALMPDGTQARSMRQFAGACRFVWNKALALQKDNHSAGLPFQNYVAQAKALTAWRNCADTSWLGDAPVHAQQQALKDLERAYKNFFAKRAAFPRFKKRSDVAASFRFPDAKQFKLDQGNARMFLPKLGWVRYRKSRDILGTAKNITVSHHCGKWYASVQTERMVDPVLHTNDKASVGIDVGVARFATLSDGTFIVPKNSFAQHRERLAKYQRRMSRKVKGSSNWNKAKRKVQRAHARIAHCRSDFLHKNSTAIAKSHALIVVEALQIKNMSASAAGTSDAPGEKVRQKAGLNRAILDQGWGEFVRQLSYKSQWVGGTVLKVPAQYTSQCCPCCQFTDRGNRKSQARFACMACGHQQNADEVAAQNIRARGLRVLACGEDAQPGSSAKQEPTEAHP